MKSWQYVWIIKTTEIVVRSWLRTSLRRVRNTFGFQSAWKTPRRELVLRESWTSPRDIKTISTGSKESWRCSTNRLQAGKCSTGAVRFVTERYLNIYFLTGISIFPYLFNWPCSHFARITLGTRVPVLITRPRDRRRRGSLHFDDWLNRGGNFHGKGTFLRRFLLAAKPTDLMEHTLYYLYRWRNRETIWPRGSQNVRSNNCWCR